MFTYIFKRLCYAIPTLFGVSLLVFLMIHWTPGDPALMLLGERANATALEEIRRELGLDQPLYYQYGLFLQRVFQGDFGYSIKSKQGVLSEFLERFPATVELAFVSMTLALFLGIGAGILSAVKRYSIFDYLSMFGALVGVSMPVFWLGLLLIYIFGVELQWLPVSGRISYWVELERVTGFYLIDTLLMTTPEDIEIFTNFLPLDYLLSTDFSAFYDALSHLVLPGLVLATIPMAIIARMTRSSLLEALQADYIKTAKAKGCSAMRVLFIHSLRNALIPVLTVSGLMVGSLLGGAVLTETVFSWPGIGKWVVHAVSQRDFPVIQCATLLFASFFIGINLLVDITYAFLNPEIRLEA